MFVSVVTRVVEGGGRGKGMMAARTTATRGVRVESGGCGQAASWVTWDGRGAVSSLLSSELLVFPSVSSPLSSLFYLSSLMWLSLAISFALLTLLAVVSSHFFLVIINTLLL